MAFEGAPRPADTDNPVINVFWLALALIIVGSGFLKANISVIVGQLYPRTDVRRDGAYTIFYMGINLGAALGSIIVGYLGETYGWAYGFGAAGIGMLLGLLVFIWGKPLLLGRGEPSQPLGKRHRMEALRRRRCCSSRSAGSWYNISQSSAACSARSARRWFPTCCTSPPSGWPMAPTARRRRCRSICSLSVPRSPFLAC